MGSAIGDEGAPIHMGKGPRNTEFYGGETRLCASD